VRKSPKRRRGKGGISENFIPGVGPVPCRIMFIGEAPGRVEDELGFPFQGRSGNILDQLLGLLGLRREEVFVTNVFKYRPPGNRDPLPIEIHKSIPCLQYEVNVVNPIVIVLLGRVASQAFFPTATLAQRRRMNPVTIGRRIVFCTYHPAATMYDTTFYMLQDLKKDFRLIGKSLE
jgi:uracil-DNA glycosylase family 4